MVAMVKMCGFIIINNKILHYINNTKYSLILIIINNTKILSMPLH